MSVLGATRCPAYCGTEATMSKESCKTCNGFGWVWADDVAPTFCPGGRKLRHEPETDARTLPCTRREATCDGCGRKRADIGTVEDVDRTWKRREEEARERIQDHLDRIRRGCA